MGVIADFTVAADDFVLAPGGGENDVYEVEVEPVVPVSGSVLPYLWVRGDCTQFELELENCQFVSDHTVLENAGDRQLYRVDWVDEFHEFLDCFVESNGTVLRMHGGGVGWRFTVRFPDDTSVSRFHTSCLENGVHIELHRLTHSPETGEQHQNEFGLTPEQHEALTHAVKTGYFSIPRRSTLDDIAAKFDISNQAASERIRRATEKVLRQALGDELDVLVEHP
ncbi:helix-turn-helix domain-containing protein [Haloarchaeobius sp. TZWWS8]|uniref:helix-turn-helix domain-containing protein n=1 Tax=Haloarchaeobius sp. TZWWS8 TaxID=3446121 RepID=UPI003EB6A217